MSKRRKIINYQEFKAPKRGRRAAVIFIDLFFAVIMTFLFFGAVSRPVYENLESTKEKYETYSNRGEELIQIVSDTHLQEVRNNELVSLSESAESYVQTLLLTTFHVEGVLYSEPNESGIMNEKEIPESDTFLASGFAKDPLAFYYLSFRVENGLAKDGQDTRFYFNKEILRLEDENKALVPADFDMNEVFVLSEANRDLLYDYSILKNETESGEELHNRLTQLYINVCSQGISEVENNYVPYQEAFQAFQDSYLSYIQGYDVALILSYALGFAFVFLLFPAIFGNGRTLSYRLFGLSCCNNVATKIPFYKLLVKDILLFITHFWACLFSLFFLGQLDVLSAPFLGSLTLLQFVVFSALLFILSLLFCLIRNQQQTLEEFSSMTFTVDLSRHEEEGIFENTETKEK